MFPTIIPSTVPRFAAVLSVCTRVRRRISRRLGLLLALDPVGCAPPFPSNPEFIGHSVRYMSPDEGASFLVALSITHPIHPHRVPSDELFRSSNHTFVDYARRNVVMYHALLPPSIFGPDVHAIVVVTNLGVQWYVGSSPSTVKGVKSFQKQVLWAHIFTIQGIIESSRSIVYSNVVIQHARTSLPLRDAIAYVLHCGRPQCMSDRHCPTPSYHSPFFSNASPNRHCILDSATNYITRHIMHSGLLRMPGLPLDLFWPRHINGYKTCLGHFDRLSHWCAPHGSDNADRYTVRVYKSSFGGLTSLADTRNYTCYVLVPCFLICYSAVEVEVSFLSIRVTADQLIVSVGGTYPQDVVIGVSSCLVDRGDDVFSRDMLPVHSPVPIMSNGRTILPDRPPTPGSGIHRFPYSIDGRTSRRMHDEVTLMFPACLTPVHQHFFMHAWLQCDNDDSSGGWWGQDSRLPPIGTLSARFTGSISLSTVASSPPPPLPLPPPSPLGNASFRSMYVFQRHNLDFSPPRLSALGSDSDYFRLGMIASEHFDWNFEEKSCVVCSCDCSSEDVMMFVFNCHPSHGVCVLCAYKMISRTDSSCQCPFCRARYDPSASRTFSLPPLYSSGTITFNIDDEGEDSHGSSIIVPPFGEGVRIGDMEVGVVSDGDAFSSTSFHFPLSGDERENLRGCRPEYRFGAHNYNLQRIEDY
jgi:hypothetical protein